MTIKPRPPGLPDPILEPSHVAWVVETFGCPVGHADRGEPCRPADPLDPYSELCYGRILRALRRDIDRHRRERERQAAHLSRMTRRKVNR